MRQLMKCDQEVLESVARKATALQNWLAETAAPAMGTQQMPQGVVAVGSVVALSGQKISMDFRVPDTVCWGGCVGVD